MKKWEFGALNIYDYHQKGTLDIYFDFIRKNFNKLEGNIFEFGVFKGKSLLATALMLKKLGSNKRVFGFDSFSGFPSYHEKDDFIQFKYLYESEKIEKTHYEDCIKNKSIRKLYLLDDVKLEPKNVSNSGDFSDNNYQMLLKKIEFLKLDNITLYKGSFKDSLSSGTDYGKAMCCLIDCDLYESYKYSLPLAWESTVENGMLYLDEDEYIEVYAYLDVNGGSGGYISNDSQGLRGNYFSAFKLII